MTALSIPLLTKGPIAAPPSGVAAPPTGAPELFAALLAPTLPPIAARHEDAATGKDLPDGSDEDATNETSAPVALPPLLPLPCDIAAAPASKTAAARIGEGGKATITPALPRLSGESRGPVSPAEVGLSAATDEGGSTQVPTEKTPTASVPPLGPGLRRGGVTEPTTFKPSNDRTPQISTPFRPVGDTEKPPVPRFDPTTQPARPTPTTDIAAIVASPRIAPAGAMFAAAIHRATQADPRDPAPGGPTILALGTDTAPHAVLAPTHAHQSALDMNRDTWPQHMIERIETLRDAADAQDTRIRLVPDRLGTIDVAVRRDGDAVQVQFVAAQPETRALLAEAQPRLAELAEARGLRLSAETSDAGGHARQHNHSQPARSTAPAHRISENDGPVADDRVA